MRTALIDLGTNAVRFDVVDVGPAGEVRRLHRERLAVSLGEGVFLKGRLTSRARDRTLAAFRSFRKTCDELKVQKISAFGTSALRDSSNSDVFLKRLKKATGIDVRVISGREEARLIAQGVLPHEKGNAKVLNALVDIGGGSVEISLCRGRRVLWSASYKLGVSRLHQVFLKTVPPSRRGGLDAPTAKLRRHVRSLLKEGAPRSGWPRVERIIGSAGTIRVLARIQREAGGAPLSGKSLARLAQRFERMSPAALARVPGMERKRVETILAGSIVLGEIATALDARRIETTDFSLRDGMLEEEVRALRRGGATALRFHLKDVFDMAHRWGLSARHLHHVEGFARRLFDGLAPLHRLSPEWREYLISASLLQDTGEAVSPVHHERHSYYLVKNADIAGLENWELEFIAQLVLWHKGSKVEKKELPFEEKGRMSAFLKLLSLLRIVDALEKPQAHLAVLRNIEQDRRRVRLFLSGERSAVDLAILRVEQKKELFERVFRRALTAHAII